jgi:hypothetical protein
MRLLRWLTVGGGGGFGLLALVFCSYFAYSVLLFLIPKGKLLIHLVLFLVVLFLSHAHVSSGTDLCCGDSDLHLLIYQPPVSGVWTPAMRVFVCSPHSVKRLLLLQVIACDLAGTLARATSHACRHSLTLLSTCSAPPPASVIYTTTSHIPFSFAASAC